MEPDETLSAAADGAGKDPIGELRRVIDAQAAVIESMRLRLDRLEGAEDVSAPAPERAANDALSPSALEAPTSRRQVMTKGAVAAAGAAIVGSVLSVTSAPPAAAAGGLVGQVSNGNEIGVEGDNFATSGGAEGVRGFTTSTEGTGVFGWAQAATGSTRGVSGQADSTSGRGVEGHATASSGGTRGVSGISDSPDGVGVVGENMATGIAESAVGVRGTAKGDFAIGVAGESTGALGVGVYGAGYVGVRGDAVTSDADGAGVFGTSKQADGSAVLGVNLLGTGVYGNGGAVGVRGLTNAALGVGVLAKAVAGSAVSADSGRTQLTFLGAPAPPLGAGLARTAGEIVFDTNQDLWVCVSAGTPGTWRRISGANTAGSLQLVTPKRVYDSRTGTIPANPNKTKWQNGHERAIDATFNSSGVPAGARAVLITATATNTNPGGFFGFWNAGAYPSTSSLNWGVANSTIATTTIVQLAPTGTFMGHMEGMGGSDLVIDVLGFYQ